MTELPPDAGPPPHTSAAAPPFGALGATNAPPAWAPAPPTNVLAILALVGAFVAPPAGLILGIIAQRQIAQSGESGSGLALAGTIVGGIFTAFIAIFLIAWLGTFVSIYATFFTVFAATGA